MCLKDNYMYSFDLLKSKSIVDYLLRNAIINLIVELIQILIIWKYKIHFYLSY